ncbi:hypothetical protein GGS23DRAFT_449765 [Durotheca rogersii]|uniref:uncharacterized protein n=1 Tax=Durotheca rogersii TaxID=419775 RepID=UPI00221FF0AB|nr:uncharacterized protein GGS23DRAFT_449765 [Durotheca rogersii]KAI5864505.1 hypothetical protein GGS23DRAFT_449765 [Durotheca rogersii]
MKLLSAVTGIIATASCVAAHPVEKREVGGILICQGAYGTGPCHHEVYAMRTCYELPEGFAQDTKTFAPDDDSFFCWPRAGTCADICRSPTGCTFDILSFYNPAIWDLSTIKWDTILGSFNCELNRTSTTA